MKVKWEAEGSGSSRNVQQKFINILRTIVAIWFALWPQRARDAPAAISAADDLQHLQQLLDETRCDGTLRWGRELRLLRLSRSCCPRSKNKKFALSSQAARRTLHGQHGLPERVTQFISFVARHKSGRATSNVEPRSVVLLGGRRQAAPSTLRVIYDFVNSLSVFYFLSLWAACKTSLLPKSFVFHSAELLRNRTWGEQQQRQLCNKCG